MTPDVNTPYEGPFEKIFSGLLKIIFFLIVVGLLTLLVGIGIVIGFVLASI